MPRTAPPDTTEAPRADPAQRVRLLHPFGAAGRWRSALREFAIIVAGVLTALGAQAWWQSRQERVLERAYLVQLLADTRENEQRLAAAITQDSITSSALARSLSALEGAGALPPPDSLVEWIRSAASVSYFQPLTGTYRALLGTGDLRLVRNDSLRALLVAYAALLDSSSGTLEQLRGVPLDAVGSYARLFPFIRREFLGGTDAASVDVDRLRHDPEIPVLLFTLQAANANRLIELRNMREETRRLRRALEAEPALRALR